MKNKSIYTLKAIACICVVFIHSGLPKSIGITINSISRFAVPFFFMVSGYFSYTYERPKLRKKFFELTTLFFISILSYYVLVNIIGYIAYPNYNIIAKTKDILSFKNIFAFIGFNDTTLIISHLWFVASLIYCYVFRYFTIHTKFEKIYKFIPFLIILGYIIQIYLLVINPNKSLRYVFRNWILIGLPFYLIGYFLNIYKEKVKALKKSDLIIFSILGICIVFIELLSYKIFKNKRYLDIYVGNIIFSISIFILSINNPNIFKFKLLSNLGEKHSLNIYLFHYGIIEIFNHIFIKKYKININSYIKALLAFIISILLSLLFKKIIMTLHDYKTKHIKLKN